MIARISNRDEVEQGLREAAELRAKKLIPAPTLNETREIQAWAIEDVATLLAIEARPAGVDEKLAVFDRTMLHWLYIAAFADAMQDRCDIEETRRIDTLAAAVLCRRCAQPFLHANHGYDGKRMISIVEAQEEGTADHVFVCPHGEEVTVPDDCVTEHPGAHSADH